MRQPSTHFLSDHPAHKYILPMSGLEGLQGLYMEPTRLPRARLRALVRSLGWSSEPCASRPGSRCTACAPRSADVAAALTALRAARSSQPPRWYEALAPASPTASWETRAFGILNLWLQVSIEPEDLNLQFAICSAITLACLALLMSRDQTPAGPRQSGDASVPGLTGPRVMLPATQWH